MPRYIDADKLIADLEHDIAVDTDMILYPGTDNMKASLYQSDKDIKQNCIDMLSKAPTADVRENVKGRWAEVVDRTEMYDKEGVKTWGMLFQCNQCGFVLNAIEGHTGQYNYCPNCGAEMGGKS